MLWPFIEEWKHENGEIEAYHERGQWFVPVLFYFYGFNNYVHQITYWTFGAFLMSTFKFNSANFYHSFQLLDIVTIIYVRTSDILIFNFNWFLFSNMARVGLSNMSLSGVGNKEKINCCCGLQEKNIEMKMFLLWCVLFLRTIKVKGKRFIWSEEKPEIGHWDRKWVHR